MFNKKIYSLLEQYTKSQNENQISALIFSAVQNVEDKVEKYELADSIHKDFYGRLLTSARSSLLGVMDEACSRYLKHDVNQERFKENYERAIILFNEDNDYQTFFDGKTFPHLVNVYSEWAKK